MRLYSEDSLTPGPRPWQQQMFEVIFHADTRPGKAFDVGLLVVILMSVLLVCLETVDTVQDRFGHLLRQMEWVITGLFTLEYVLRLACVEKRRHYVLSFYGLVDLLAVLPTWMSLFVAGTHYLAVVRVLRLLRIFRIFKLTRFVTESSTLGAALVASRHKIAVFLFVVLNCVVIIGALMYLIEGEASGFDNIPVSIYWAIVTLTTVGYGDIAPVTPLGQIVASMVMILGYGIIAVPTGIVTVELGRRGARRCPACGRGSHENDAVHCKHCGSAL